MRTYIPGLILNQTLVNAHYFWSTRRTCPIVLLIFPILSCLVSNIVCMYIVGLALLVWSTCWSSATKLLFPILSLDGSCNIVRTYNLFIRRQTISLGLLISYIHIFLDLSWTKPWLMHIIFGPHGKLASSSLCVSQYSAYVYSWTCSVSLIHDVDPQRLTCFPPSWMFLGLLK